MSRTAEDKEKSRAAPSAIDIPDVLQPPEEDEGVVDADAYGPYALPEERTPEWLRMQQARLLLREFLSVVPRTEETTTITFLRVDGTQQTLSRQELSAAIDRMRPRQRQIVRLAIESHWSQERVCAVLKGISVRTVQRDLAEALDRLAEL
jgi:DNA-directed RNA polymerase specialized sigma24 family protein